VRKRKEGEETNFEKTAKNNEGREVLPSSSHFPCPSFRQSPPSSFLSVVSISLLLLPFFLLFLSFLKNLVCVLFFSIVVVFRFRVQHYQTSFWFLPENCGIPHT